MPTTRSGRLVPSAASTLSVLPRRRLNLSASPRPITTPLGSAASASSEPFCIFSSMVVTCFIFSGTTPDRVTPCCRPAKVSTAASASTGAARTPGSPSMKAQPVAASRECLASRAAGARAQMDRSLGPVQRGRLRAALANVVVDGDVRAAVDQPLEEIVLPIRASGPKRPRRMRRRRRFHQHDTSVSRLRLVRCASAMSRVMSKMSPTGQRSRGRRVRWGRESSVRAARRAARRRGTGPPSRRQ